MIHCIVIVQKDKPIQFMRIPQASVPVVAQGWWLVAMNDA